MNLGGEQPGNTGKTIRNTGSSVLIPGGGPASHLQNLSNWLCKDYRPLPFRGYDYHKQEIAGGFLRAGYTGNDPAFGV
jgi:hypothetical protein